MRRILVDTDNSLGTPGAEIDDGAALIMIIAALNDSRTIRVEGVTTVHGNVRLELGKINTMRLLGLLGCQGIPVFAGADSPLFPDPAWATWLAAWYSRYGQTPPWPGRTSSVSAANAIVDFVRRFPGEVTLLALGPLTNLALALRQDPGIAGQVAGVIAMGGSLGEEHQEAEFNFRCDPEAAQVVLEAGWPVKLLGLDITGRIPFPRSDFDALPEDSAAHALLKNQAVAWLRTVEEQGWGKGGTALHDAVAVAALLDETLFEFTPVYAEVEMEAGSRRGLIRAAVDMDGRSEVKIARSVDIARCYDLIHSHVFSIRTSDLGS